MLNLVNQKNIRHKIVSSFIWQSPIRGEDRRVGNSEVCDGCGVEVQVYLDIHLAGQHLVVHQPSHNHHLQTHLHTKKIYISVKPLIFIEEKTHRNKRYFSLYFYKMVFYHQFNIKINLN